MQAAQSQLASPPDFDFQMPCRYFKSSFARSLSLNGAGSGAGGGSAALALPKHKKPQTNEVTQQQQPQQQRQKQRQNKEQPIEAEMDTDEELEGEQESSCCSTPPPALPARRHTSGHNNNLMHFSSAAANQLLLSPPPAPMQTQRNPNHVWPMQQQQPQASQSTLQQDSSSSSSNMMTMRAAAPSCHSHSHQSQSYHNHYDLQPQQQQQQLQHQQQQQQHPLNVEAVILQNQVDTLHWQLKQTETNCEMYRAVMEEVARFFERYQQQLHLQQTHRNGEQIARSKSLHHVHGSMGSSLQSDQRDGLLLHDEDAVSASYLRARSSTNLMLNKSMHAMNEEQNYEAIAPAGSYNAFKDFTWRRSPKKTGGCKARLSAPEVAEEKLNQEAFRLARTIRNLLHTSEQQPDLTQPRHSLASVTSLPGNGNGNGNHMPHLHRLCKAKTSSVMTLLQTPPRHNSTSIMNATMEVPSPSPAHSATTAGKSHAEMLFLRANTMRDSRLSLRSSTDSSVHSTISSTASSISSKIETDEDTNNNNTNNSNNNNLTTTGSSNAAATAAATTTAISHNKKPQPTTNGGGSSSTEDESGFSSISSFHDVGLPLSSTLIGGGGAVNHQRRLSISTTDSRNSTLKSGALNVLGVPLQQTQALNQSQNPQQCNTQPSKTTYRNAGRYQRFSTLSNEDAAAVLWV